jgi:hypothetical protein
MKNVIGNGDIEGNCKASKKSVEKKEDETTAWDTDRHKGT